MVDVEKELYVDALKCYIVSLYEIIDLNQYLAPSISFILCHMYL